MLKKLVLVLMGLCLFPSLCFAVVVDTNVSANTVSFNTTGIVVSFNSVTNHIRMWNASTTTDCYADIRCRDSNKQRGYISRNQNESATILMPRAGSVSPNTIELDFATQNLGFISDAGSGSVNYIVTGDRGSL